MTLVKQTAFQRYLSILRFHGLSNGPRRAWEQFSQVDLYDYLHGIETRLLVTVEARDPGGVSNYGPNYTASSERPLRRLISTCPEMGSTRLAFIDLGCGKGKVLHVAKRVLPRAKLFGVDLHPGILETTRKNLGEAATLVNANVLDVDYASLLGPQDVIVVFNKNSFDRATVETTLARIKACAPAVFYIYSNPVYGDLFACYQEVFSMTGWHKNWQVKAWKVR